MKERKRGDGHVVRGSWLLTCVEAAREGTAQNVNHLPEIAKPSCPDLYEGHPREQVLSAHCVKPRLRETGDPTALHLKVDISLGVNCLTFLRGLGHNTVCLTRVEQ